MRRSAHTICARPGVAARVCRARRSLGAGTVCILLLAFGATAAHAELNFNSTFGENGEGKLDAPQGIGVDQTTLDPTSGDVYVADTGNARVEQFSSTGEFLSAWGWGVADGENAPEVCTSACHAGIPGSGAGQFNAPISIAVNSASGPAQGDVYVGDSANNVIDEFSPSGSLLGTITGPSAGNAFHTVEGVAVDGEGNLWVVDDGTDNVYEFSSAGALLNQFYDNYGGTLAIATDPAGGVYLIRGAGETERWTPAAITAGAPEPVDSHQGTGLAIDPSSGDLYVDLGASIDQWGPSSESLGNFGSGSLGHGSQMAYNPNVTLPGAGGPGALYVADENDNRVAVFVPPVPAAPTVVGGSEAATGITSASATLEASINANGLDTTYYFEYGPTSAYGTQAPLPPGTDIGSDYATVVEKLLLTELPASTTFHFRVVAINSAGTTDGPDQTFTTATPRAPVVESATAVNITSSKATLQASVNPEFGDTHYYFEYGPTEAYGTQVPAPPGTDIGESNSAQNAEATLSGLSATSTYHFRVVAINSAGTTDGPDQTFTTATPQAPAVESETAVNVSSSKATLQASVNSESADTHYYFEYGPTAAYGTQVPAPPGTDIGESNSAQNAEAAISGLSASTTYHFRVVAVNSLGTTDGADQTFTTAPPVDIEAESAANVTATTADLTAKLGTENSATSYRFEYGTTPAYGLTAPQPEATLAASASAQRVTVHLQNLQPHTTYYFRVVATNALGTATGSGASFTTYQPGEAFALPDSRAYELVSPPDKNGGDVGGAGSFLAPPPTALGDSSASGAAITYVSATGFGDAQSALLTTQYLSTRGPSGWTTHSISPPSTLMEHVELAFAPFHLFTAELTAWVFSWKQPPLTPDAPPETNNLYRGEAGAAYQLIDDGTLAGPPAETNELQVLGASSDLRHVVFEASEPLLPGAPAHASSVYEWSAGALRLVSVLPGPGEVVAESAYGAGRGIQPSVVSADGSRIFWTDGNRQNLYVREDGNSTVQLNLSQRTPSLGDGTAQFVAATPDGSRVFFTDATALTNAAADNGGLYEYSFASKRLTDLTPDAAGPPEVEGVLGISEDGASVYFVAGASLPSNAAPGGGQPSPGGHNLYLARNGAFTFIARLSESDTGDWAGSGVGSFSERTAQVTPDGGTLAFMSKASLTGYDNTDLDTGEADAELFLYDAGTGTLRCVSCNPSGARPIGPASVPTPQESAHLPRYLSEDGRRLFFDSKDALLPAASNGQQNVYEYEDGAIHLISSGTSEQASALVDASADGDDVFFTTSARLVPEDQDEHSDMYDARVDGGFPAANPPATCSGEGCRGPIGAPPAPLAIATEETHAGEAAPAQPGAAAPTPPARPHKAARPRHKSRARHTARRARRSRGPRGKGGADRRRRATRRSSKQHGRSAARRAGSR